MKKRIYTKPKVSKVNLDYTISLLMQSTPPAPPPHRSPVGSKGTDEPFASPFDYKPFG